MRKKNKKRINPRYFLHETTLRTEGQFDNYLSGLEAWNGAVGEMKRGRPDFEPQPDEVSFVLAVADRFNQFADKEYSVPKWVNRFVEKLYVEDKVAELNAILDAARKAELKNPEAESQLALLGQALSKYAGKTYRTARNVGTATQPSHQSSKYAPKGRSPGGGW